MERSIPFIARSITVQYSFTSLFFFLTDARSTDGTGNFFLTPTICFPEHFNQFSNPGYIHVRRCNFYLIFHCSYQKPPKAVGYPDNVNTLYKAVSVAEFITSDKHLTLMAGCSKLEFDRRSEVFARHPLTTETVRLLCDDVKVLGPTELRQLVSGCGAGFAHWFQLLCTR